MVVEVMVMGEASIELVEVVVVRVLHKEVGEGEVVLYKEEVMGEVESGQEAVVEVMDRHKQAVEVENLAAVAEKERVEEAGNSKWEAEENTRVEEEVVEGAESNREEVVKAEVEKL